jgi:phospholipid/cholesterol/gamma-HCH transport system permease protein
MTTSPLPSAPPIDAGVVVRSLESVGRSTARSLDEVGHAAALLAEALKWIFVGPSQRQPVRTAEVFVQMMRVGIQALPIVMLLSATIGIMLAVQGIYSLSLFGAESYVYVGIALSVTREFAPLITAILIAGRSGSALAARLSTMTINQEVDALRAMGINPVRFLVAPALIAMLVMLPSLTVWSNLVSFTAAGIYVATTLDISMAAFHSDVLSVLSVDDIVHGLVKSLAFAVLIVTVCVVNGLRVQGGAEGVGRVTTRAVVQSICAIIVTDMIVVTIITPGP